MWVQHSGGIYSRENNGSIYGMDAPVGQSRPNGPYVFPNRGCSQQSLSFPFGTVLVIQGSPVYVVDYCSNRSRWGAWASTMETSARLNGVLMIFMVITSFMAVPF